MLPQELRLTKTTADASCAHCHGRRVFLPRARLRYSFWVQNKLREQAEHETKIFFYIRSINGGEES
jgi:hypothetical protein